MYAQQIAEKYAPDRARDCEIMILRLLEAQVAVAVAAEREACAKVADSFRHDEFADGILFRDFDVGADAAAEQIAVAIRARSNTPT